MATSTATPKNQFTVNLEGLNLPDEHMARINAAIQSAVLQELATLNFNIGKGGLLTKFGPGTRGIIYLPDISKF